MYACITCTCTCTYMYTVVCGLSSFYRSENGYTSLHFFLVVISLIGFLFFDLLYIAVTINYCSQCQLLTFYIENVLDKVRNKKYRDLNLASQVSKDCVDTCNVVVHVHVCTHACPYQHFIPTSNTSNILFMYMCIRVFTLAHT